MFKSALKKIKGKAKNWFLYIALLGILLNVAGTSFGIDKIKQLGAYASIISVLLCFAYVVVLEEANVQSLLMLAFVCYSIGVLIITQSVSYRNIIDMLTFLEMPILFFCYDREDRKNVLHVIFLLFLGISALFFLCSFQKKFYNPLHNNALAIGPHPDVNPNQTALQLTQGLFIILCAVYYYKDIKLKLLYIVGAVVTLYVIYLTKSRTCLVIAAVGIVLVLIQKFIKVKPILILICFLVPLIMAIFILHGEAIYSNWNFLGEAFDTGRKRIYEIPFLNMNFKKFLFGDVGFHTFDNDHNAFLTVFANLGAIGFCSFFFFIMHKMIKTVSRPLENYQNVAVIGMLTLILHASMEASSFMTTLAYLMVPFFLLYLIANTTEKKALKGFEKRAHNLF